MRFAAAARALGAAARAGGYVAPSFRSPPRVPGRMRTIRHHGTGSATVSVVVRGRPWSAVLADMIDGFVAVNGGLGGSGEILRDLLWAAMEEIDIRDTPKPTASALRVVDDAA